MQRTLQESVIVPEETTTSEPTTKLDSQEETPPAEGTDHSSEDAADILKSEFYRSHSSVLVPVLLKLMRKLLSFAHHCISRDIFNPDQNLAEDMLEVINKILGVSGTKSIIGKPHVKPLFISHVPPVMLDSLKSWNSIVILEKQQISKLCFDVSKVNVNDEIVRFIDASVKSFCGSSTFNPSHILKSSLLISTTLLASIFKLDPEDSKANYMSDVVPFATDLLLEFTASSDNSNTSDVLPLKDIATLFDNKLFSQECVKYKVSIYLYIYIFIYIYLSILCIYIFH